MPLPPTLIIIIYKPNTPTSPSATAPRPATFMGAAAVDCEAGADPVADIDMLALLVPLTKDVAAEVAAEVDAAEPAPELVAIAVGTFEIVTPAPAQIFSTAGARPGLVLAYNYR